MCVRRSASRSWRQAQVSAGTHANSEEFGDDQECGQEDLFMKFLFMLGSFFLLLVFCCCCCFVSDCAILESNPVT